MRRILSWTNEPDRFLSAPPLTAAGVTIVRCSSGDSLQAALESDRCDCAILDPVTAADWLGATVSRQMLATTPIVWRFVLTPEAARRITLIAGWLPNGRVSLRGFDDLNADVDELLQSPIAPTAELRVLEGLALGPPPQVHMAVVAAAILGRRRRRLADLARACRAPPRTIQWQLSHHGEQTASDLLGWSVALHTMWRVDVLNWSLKRSAVTAGFPSGDALSDYVCRHVGRRPRTLHLQGGFEALLGQWRGLLSRRSAASHERRTE